MLINIIPSVVLNVIMPSVIKLSVVMMNVVMLSNILPSGIHNAELSLWRVSLY
jgi:hypothetical protein